MLRMKLKTNRMLLFIILNVVCFNVLASTHERYVRPRGCRSIKNTNSLVCQIRLVRRLRLYGFIRIV